MRCNPFFLLKFLFISAIFFIFIYYCFTNALKPRHVLDIFIDYFWNCQKSDRSETKKNIIWDNFFYFQNFQAFGNAEIDFGTNLSKCFS